MTKVFGPGTPPPLAVNSMVIMLSLFFLKCSKIRGVNKKNVGGPALTPPQKLWSKTKLLYFSLEGFPCYMDISHFYTIMGRVLPKIANIKQFGLFKVLHSHYTFSPMPPLGCQYFCTPTSMAVTACTTLLLLSGTGHHHTMHHIIHM